VSKGLVVGVHTAIKEEIESIILTETFSLQMIIFL